jgi:probable HAF family extracellular repeat protein
MLAMQRRLQMKSITLFAFSFLMLAAASAAAQKIQYFQYPGAPNTTVTGVSNTGVILGYSIDQQGNSQGFSLSNGQYTIIDNPNGTATIPTGVNSGGTIVGYYLSSATENNQAFSYSDGTFTDISPGTDCIASAAFGINDLGQMAGQCETETFLLEGWIYKDGTYQLLSVPGSAWSYATDINIHGSTTMIYSTGTGANRVQSAIYNGSTFHNIDEPNRQNTYAWAINAQASVAISWVSGDSGYGAIMVGSTYHNIQPAKCTSGTGITGINDHGLAVGVCGTGGNSQIGMTVAF